MKTDLLNAIDVYATGMQWAVWIWIGSALLLTALAAWAAIAISCRVFNAFARTNQTWKETP